MVLVYVIHLHYETGNIPKWVPLWGPRVLINLDGWMGGWIVAAAIDGDEDGTRRRRNRRRRRRWR